MIEVGDESINIWGTFKVSDIEIAVFGFTSHLISRSKLREDSR